MTTNTPPPAEPECGAKHESHDLTGIRCELRPGHRGDHQVLYPLTWPNEPAVPAGRGAADGGAK